MSIAGLKTRTEIPLVCIESRRESVHITRGIGTAATAGNSGESDEYGRFFIFRREEGGGRDVRPVSVGGEDTVGADAAGVHRTLGDLTTQF